jgi:hypothetical protein
MVLHLNQMVTFVHACVHLVIQDHSVQYMIHVVTLNVKMEELNKLMAINVTACAQLVIRDRSVKLTIHAKLIHA